MAWKTDESGALTMQDGNPVWIYETGPETGREAPVEFGKTLLSIQNLTRESMNRKERIKVLQSTADKIEAAGIEDLDAWMEDAKKALETVRTLDDAQAATAAEMEKMKQSIADSYKRQIEALKESAQKSNADWQARLDAKQQSIERLIIRGAFESSEFLREKTVMLPDMAYSYLGGQFRVEEQDGRLTGYAVDRNGDRIMSLKHPGQFADPAEAIEIIVNDHPQKERLLRMNASGSGMGTPAGGEPGNDLTARYQAAKKKGDVGAMIALKGQMVDQGMPTPL